MNTKKFKITITENKFGSVIYSKVFDVAEAMIIKQYIFRNYIDLIIENVVDVTMKELR